MAECQLAVLVLEVIVQLDARSCLAQQRGERRLRTSSGSRRRSRPSSSSRSNAKRETVASRHAISPRSCKCAIAAQATNRIKP
jgi:hypothetical protein